MRKSVVCLHRLDYSYLKWNFKVKYFKMISTMIQMPFCEMLKKKSNKNPTKYNIEQKLLTIIMNTIKIKRYYIFNLP